MSERGILLSKTRYEVPFYWADPAGLMFFGYIYLAAQLQWEAWARGNPDIWSVWFSSKDVAYPIRHSSAEHFYPMRFGESFDVTIWVQSTTQSSFVLKTDFSKQSKIHASVKTVHTAMDVQKMKKGLIDPRFLDLLSLSVDSSHSFPANR